MFSFINSLYNYGKLFFSSISNEERIPDISIKNVDILFNRINQCGAVCIKFSQWLLPIIDNYYIKDEA